MRDSELSNESNTCDAVPSYDEGRARLVVIREPCEDDGQYGGEEIDGDCEELSVCGGIAETVDYSGYRGRETTAGVSKMRWSWMGRKEKSDGSGRRTRRPRRYFPRRSLLRPRLSSLRVQL
jgi:hypothetical protein